MTELYEKESDDADYSGWGFEFTFRIPRDGNEEAPIWPAGLMNNLARYVFDTGNFFDVGHQMPLNGPIKQGDPTDIQSIIFIKDPELGEIETPNGQVVFLQIVGITNRERTAIESWNAQEFGKLIAKFNPNCVTDLNRADYLELPEFAQEVEQGAKRDGSSCSVLYAPDSRFESVDGKHTLRIGAIAVEGLCTRLVGRIPFGRELALVEESSITFRPAERFVVESGSEGPIVGLTDAGCQQIADELPCKAGSYTFSECPDLTIVVNQTEITNNDGDVVDTMG